MAGSRTIHEDHYKLSADTSGFRKDLVASKKELSDSKRILRETQTPLQKYEDKVKKVENLVSKGVITQKQANQAVAHYKTSLLGATKQQGFFNTALGKTKGLLVGLAAGLTLRKFIRETKEAFSRLDDLQKQSKTLDIGAGSLLAIQQAGGLSAGLGSGQINNALEKQLKSVGDAVQGKGTGKDRLEQLKLNAEELQKLSADKQLLRIADAIKEVNNKNEQVAITQDIFGRSNAKMVELLRLGSKEIKGQTEFLSERAKFLDANAHKVEATNDAFSKLGSSIDFVFEQVAVGLSGDLSSFAQTFDRMVKSGQIGELATAFGKFAVNTGELLIQLEPLVTGMADLLNMPLTALKGPNATFEDDPLIGQFANNNGPAGAFFSTLGRQAEKLLGIEDRNAQAQMRANMNRGGGIGTRTDNTDKEIGKWMVNELLKGNETGGFKGLGKTTTNIVKSSNRFINQFGRFTEKLNTGFDRFSKEFVAGVKEKRIQNQADAFANFDPSKNPKIKALNEEESRLQKRLSEIGDGPKRNRQTGRMIGSSAGRESIEAFRAMFGVGNENKLVDEMTEIKDEVKDLKNKLLAIAAKRGETEQKLLAEEMANF